MQKPQKQDYGWTEDTGWTQGDKARFEYDTETWKIVTRKPGRQRTRPIHPSWSEVLKQFDSNDSTRSQGAFCRWAEINRSTFSAMQCKPIEQWVIDEIGSWISATEKEVENE